MSEFKSKILKSLNEELEKREVTILELVQIMANVTGRCSAFLNPEIMSPSEIDEIINKNIDIGHLECSEEIQTKNYYKGQ